MIKKWQARLSDFHDRLRDTFKMKANEAMYVVWHFNIENDEQFLNFDVDASFNESYKGWDIEHIKQVQLAMGEKNQT